MSWVMGDTAEAYDIRGVKTWALRAKCSKCGLVCWFIEAHGIYTYCPRCGEKNDCDILDGDRLHTVDHRKD